MDFARATVLKRLLYNLLKNANQSWTKKGLAGVILIYLSKAFDCQKCKLLIAKLSAYGFSRPALKLIYSYVHEMQQMVKINGSFSTLKQTSLGVPKDRF